MVLTKRIVVSEDENAPIEGLNYRACVIYYLTFAASIDGENWIKLDLQDLLEGFSHTTLKNNKNRALA